MPDGCCTTVASIDIVVNADHGNLRDRLQPEKWLTAIRSGIAGIYGGAPCGTVRTTFRGRFVKAHVLGED